MRLRLRVAWWILRSLGHYVRHGNLDAWTEPEPT